MTKFKDLSYTRPDIPALKKEFSGSIKKLKKASTLEEADAAFTEIQGIVERVETQQSIAYIRNTVNMADEFYDKEIKFFNNEMPKLMTLIKAAGKAMLKCPFRPQLEEKYGSKFFKDIEIQNELFKPSIILETIKESNLSTEYSKTAASCSVEFMGEKCNFYGLLRHMQSTDRKERKEAFEAWAKLYEGISGKLDDIYDKLVNG